MIKYICKNCNDLICETSVCKVCGSRTEIHESLVYYCQKCNAPSYYGECQNCGSECKYIGTDLRPVFPEERLLLEVLEQNPFKYANKAVWNVGSNHYIVDGEKKNISYKEYREKNKPEDVIKALMENELENKYYVDSYLQSQTIVNFIKMVFQNVIQLIRHDTLILHY